MESSRKPRTRDRISSLFKKGKNPTQNADQSATPGTDERPLVPFDDRQRTRARYEEAAKLLRKAIKSGGKWAAFDFPELKGEPEDFNDSQFRKRLDTAMEAHDKDIKDKEGWAKCRQIVQRVFEACSPFAKNFLTIGTNVQSVNVDSYSPLTIYRCIESLRITCRRVAFPDTSMPLARKFSDE